MFSRREPQRGDPKPKNSCTSAPTKYHRLGTPRWDSRSRLSSQDCGRVCTGACAPAPLTEPDLWTTHLAPQVGRSHREQHRLFTRDLFAEHARASVTFTCRGGRICRLLVSRYQQQLGFSLGYVRHLNLFAPFRAVAKHERQLAQFSPPQLVTPFTPPTLPGSIAPMG